jgi:TP901 family phage tail tape measure protein
VTTPSGGSEFIIGANAKPAIDEFKRYVQALQQLGDISKTQAAQIRGSLTNLERGHINLASAMERIAKQVVPGMSGALGKLQRDLQRSIDQDKNKVTSLENVARAAREAQTALERASRVPNLGPSSAVPPGFRSAVGGAGYSPYPTNQSGAPINVLGRTPGGLSPALQAAQLAMETRKLREELQKLRDNSAERRRAGEAQRDATYRRLNPYATPLPGSPIRPPSSTDYRGSAGRDAQAASEAMRAQAKAALDQAELLRRMTRLGQGVYDAMERERKAREDAARAIAGRINTPGPPGSGGGFPPGFAPYSGVPGSGGSGGGGGFIAQARQGFSEGRGDKPLGYQIGQVFRTSLLYSSAFVILRGIRDTFQQSLQEAIEFQTSISELAAATGRTRDEVSGLANSLAEEANKYGFTGSAGVRAGTRAIGVFRGLDKTQSQQDTIARTATSAITQQAFLSGKDVDELTANIAAIAQAFELGAESISRITDTTTFFEKQFGIAIGSLSESLPAIASLAAQGGFSIEQASGLAAAVQSRQAGTPAAASGLLSQILTREGEGTVQAVYESLGIVGNNMKERFEKLALLLPTLTETQRGQVASGFGRGRSQSAAIGLLEELERVMKLAGRAGDSADEGGAVGLASQQTKTRLSDIGGQLRQFSGALSEFKGEFSRTGILAILGGLALGFKELVEITNNVLEVWNEVPGVTKAAVGAILAYTIALKAGAFAALAARYQGALASGSRGGYLGPAPAPGRFGAAGAQGRAGLAAVGLTPATAIIAGVVVAAGTLKGSFDSVAKASQAARDALVLTADVQTDNLDAMKGALSSIVTARKEREDAKPFLADRVFGGLTGARDAREKEVATLHEKEILIQKRVNELQEKEKTVDPREGGAFGDLSTTSVERGLQNLENRGFSAAEALNLLNRAMDETTRSSTDAAAAFDSERLANDLVINLEKSIADSLAGDAKFKDSFIKPSSGAGFFERAIFGEGLLDDLVPAGKRNPENTVRTGDYDEIINDIIGGLPKRADLINRFNELISARESGGITDAEVGEITQKMVELSIADPAGLEAEYGPEAVGAVTEAIRNNIQKIVAAATANTRSGPDESSNIYKNRTAYLDLARKNTEQLAAGGNESGRARGLRGQIDLLQQIVRQTPSRDSVAGSMLEIRELEIELSEIEIDRVQNETRALLATGDISGSDVLAKAQGNLNKAVTIAGEAGNLDALKDLLVNTNEATVELARKAYLRFLDAQEAAELALAESGREIDGIRAKYEASKGEALEDFESAVTVSRGRSDTQGQVAAAAQAAKAAGTKSETDDARAELAQAEADLQAVAAQGKTNSVEYQNALGRVNSAKLAIAEAEKESAELLKDLLGALVGGQLANAISQLRDAEAELRVAETEAEKRNAQIAVLNAQRDKRAAERLFRSNRRRLNLDRTNPAQVAREEARLARQELEQESRLFRQSDSAGGSRITRAERDRINELTLASEDADQNAKSTKLQQSITTAQTAYNLGRLSHSEYMRFINNQINLLEDQIKGMDRTTNGYKAANDTLDQLRGILKETESALSGQFNLGDIQLPTPYQVRRYIKSAVGASAVGGGSTVNSNNSITLNGLTADQMQAFMESMFGTSAQTGGGY